MEKKLGKIKKATIGFGGYQDVQFGISFVLGNEEWCCCDFWGFWGHKRPDGAEWTEETRIRRFGKIFKDIHSLLKKAKVEHVEDLKGIPVEALFFNNRLNSWEILSEVL